MKSVTNKLTLSLTALILSAGISAIAANLAPSGNAEDTSAIKEWHKKLTQNAEDKASGSGCFQTNGNNIWALSPELIEIDPDKTYKLSGTFKSIGTDKGHCYLGLAMYDANKKLITYSSVSCVRGTQTQLVDNAKAGDHVIKLADCSKWNIKQLARSAIAFGAKKNLSDIPNNDLSSQITKLEKKDDIYEVTLTKPLKKDYPAGTSVRQHYSRTGYQYYAASKKYPPNEWTTYSSATIKGVPKGIRSNMFWPGTKYVKIIMILNLRPKEGENCITLADDISFEEVK